MCELVFIKNCPNQFMFLISLGWANGACSEDGLDETNKGKDRRRGRRKLLHVVEGG